MIFAKLLFITALKSMWSSELSFFSSGCLLVSGTLRIWTLCSFSVNFFQNCESALLVALLNLFYTLMTFSKRSKRNLKKGARKLCLNYGYI